MTPPKSTVTNVIDEPSVSLQRFDLLDLQPYTQEKVYATTASKDFHLFYVGRDDVHDILKHVLSRVSVSLYLNMFGFDDDELNDILMKIALDDTITMLVTLDKSQAGGKHEKVLLDLDRRHNLGLFNTHFVTKTHVQEFVLGQSATHQISHTKGFVADGRVAGEGSTNWSDSGEGTFVVKGAPGGAGYKAQNNTQSIITDPDTVSRFSAELIAEHMVAQKQAAGVSAGTNRALKPGSARGGLAAKPAPPHPGLARRRRAAQVGVAHAIGSAEKMSKWRKPPLDPGLEWRPGNIRKQLITTRDPRKLVVQFACTQWHTACFDRGGFSAFRECSQQWRTQPSHFTSK